MFKKVKLIDLLLILVPLILVALSVALIYSLVFSSDDKVLALRQIVFVIIGLAAMFSFTLIDYRSLRSLWWVFYLVSVILLVIVDLFGQVSGGAMRWINLGFFQLQPSEVAKMALIITLAAFFSGKVNKLSLKDYFWSAILFVIPFLLIIKEPDLGTAMVVAFIYFILILYTRPSKIQFATITLLSFLFISVFVLAVFNISSFGKLIQPYQRERIETFLNPGKDPYGQGYNVRQAQITIGSGGLLGRGLGQGSQSQLKFLPKPHTDFIFAGVGEALGFVGSSLVILLFCLFIYRILSIASYSQDNFGMLVAAGTAAMFLFQIVINTGMNLGLAPVTGIPLPFLSSGGTSMVISFAMLGIVQSVYIKYRQANLPPID